jgi:hypothetical protein
MLAPFGLQGGDFVVILAGFYLTSISSGIHPRGAGVTVPCRFSQPTVA